MNEVIVADVSGVELRSMLFSRYDFEVGDFNNTFEVTCQRDEWKNLPENARIYVPDTEYGGLYKTTDVDTKHNNVKAGGFTWRGMLQKRRIIPPAGQDYATDTGELNAVIGARVAAAYPNIFVGSSETTGISVSNYRYARYCTLYDGLKEMLRSKGYRIRIKYDQELAKAIVDAVPIVDYSSQIEYSSDMNADYTMILDYTGVNHLICLGNGELRERTVVHLYVSKQGVISRTQSQFDEDEITDIYDYSGASESDLIQSGTDQLKRDMNRNKFEISLDSAKEVAVGDIVGSRDYVTGLTMTAPITTKIVKWERGFATIQYKLSEDVTVGGE